MNRGWQLAFRRGHSALAYVDFMAMYFGLYLWLQGADSWPYVLGLGLLIYYSAHGLG